MTAVLLWIDYEVLRFLNVTVGNPVLDQFWLCITHLDRQAWFMFGVLPLMLVVFLYIYRLKAIKPLLAVALVVALSDALAYRVIKTLINRPRPFQNPEIASWLRHVGDAAGASFPSNHAANCFAGACVLAWYFGRRRYLFYGFASLVAISRVALGVHYPSDVLGGAMLGILVGLLVRSALLNQVKWFSIGDSVSNGDPDSGNWRLRTRRLEED
jgi:undecaprenyl-diphosphatase